MNHKHPWAVDQAYLHMTLMESSAACTPACSSAILMLRLLVLKTRAVQY